MRPQLHARAQIRRASPLLVTFLASCDGSECWIWPACRERNGYGLTSWRDADNRQRKTTAHRLAYVLHRGDIPDGHTIDHLCRNRACCNPAHLEAVTPAENLARATGSQAASVRAKRLDGTCRVGHAEWNEFGQCAACIRERQRGDWAKRNAAAARLGLTKREYGARYGYSLATAQSILREAADV